MFALENPQHEPRERDGQRISSMYDHAHTEGQKDGEQNKREREQKCWKETSHGSKRFWACANS